MYTVSSVYVTISSPPGSRTFISVYIRVFIAVPVQDRGHGGGAGARAAGLCFAAAALPYAHLQMFSAHHLDKFSVHPVGEQRVIFE